MLGIAIYPEKAGQKEILDYLDLAAKYNVKRVFTCLLSVSKPKEEIKEDFLTIINHARSLNMHVVLDISPQVFDELGINYSDLSFFSELNANGIRLDLGFDGMIESEMTFNKYDLDIEINMSSGTNYLDNIMSYHPNKNKLIGSHNFYPQKYTGLNYDHFIKCSEKFKKFNINTAAFVNSQSALEGPWPVMEGLCTLEMHRNIPIETQIKHMYATGLIDDILIANQFCSEEEFEKIADIKPNMMQFSVVLDESITPLEKTIVLDEKHFNRGDINDYLIRSTQSRVKYKNEKFPVTPATKIIKKGSIVIGNDNFGQYKGELQLVKNDIIDENNSRNVVGHVCDHEIFLIDYLQAWSTFEFKEYNKKSKS